MIDGKLTGVRGKSDGTGINTADAFQQIKSGITAHITMDSYRAAIEDGNGYLVEFSDYTGFNAGTSYYYILKNTSLTKDIWIKPVEFDSGDATSGSIAVGVLKALQILVIKDGLFSLDGGTTYVNLDDYTTSAYDAFKVPALNQNGNYPDDAALGLWFFTGIATAAGKTITWSDTATNKLLKQKSSALYKNKKSKFLSGYTARRNAYGNHDKHFIKKAGYTVSAEWAEVEQ